MPDEVYRDLLRRMTPEQKLRVALDMCTTARKLKAMGLRSQHPEWTEEEVQAEVRRTFVNART